MGKRITQDEFLVLCKKIHGNLFDYSKVRYKNTSDEIIIICKIHGEFILKPREHISRKRGCPSCGIAKRNSLNTKTNNDFLNDAKSVHGNKYDYSKVIYKDCKTKIIIICKKHGVFYQKPKDHLIGNGCHYCKAEKTVLRLNKTLKSFIEESNKIHNFKYDYSKTIYIKSNMNVIIICPDHGEFSQVATVHVSGHGCQSCGHIISNSEKSWLKYLGINEDLTGKSLKINNKRFKPDAFDEKNKIIYEFYGDFWHGNPNVYDQAVINTATKKTFGELYNKTMCREKFLIDAGYKLITIWESDWNKIKNDILIKDSQNDKKI